MYLKQENITPEHKKVFRYKNGEVHKYLGHFYTLDVRQSTNTPRVYIEGKQLVVECPRVNNIEEKEYLVNAWYEEQANKIFVPIMADTVIKTQDLELDFPTLRIYYLPDRWGSCSPKNKIIILNSELIKVPKFCIEYIALHEMIHLKYASHNGSFYAALGNVMPDWRKREAFLNKYYPL